MRSSLDYTRSFFDVQQADAIRRRTCEQDFAHGLTAELTRLGADAIAAEGTARQLWRRMVRPGRHYHTPVHVLAMFGWADRLEMALESAEALAVWFHDAVWSADAREELNERRSAAYLGKQASRLGLDPDVAEEACAIIRWTAWYLDDAVPPRGARVLDLDLAGLAAEPSVFRAQARAVRAELAHLDDRTFARGTIKLFEGLLRRPRVYRSEPAAVLERPARARLHEEISRLSRIARTGDVDDPTAAEKNTAPPDAER